MLDDDKTVEVGYVPDDGDEGVSSEGGDMGQREKESLGHIKKGVLKKTLAEYEKLKTDLSSLTTERDDLKDKYLRTLADFDNFRKRMRREKEDFQQYHLSEFLNDLLPVLDNLERALKVQKDEAPNQSVLSGVEMIFKLLLDILKRHGVEEIQAQNMPFDPTLHQALAKGEDGAVSEPLVSEVYQKGFFYNSKLLRPALVRVVLPLASGSDTVVERE